MAILGCEEEGAEQDTSANVGIMPVFQSLSSSRHGTPLTFGAKMTLLILIVLFAAFAGCTLRSFFLFDEILRGEYHEFPEAWEQDGKPIGFFWVPKEGKVLSGSSARSGLFMTWAFSVPRWAASRSDMLPLFARLKRASITAICIWAVSMIVLFTFPK